MFDGLSLRRPIRTRSIAAALPFLALAAVATTVAWAEPCLPPTPVPDFANAAIKITDLGHRTYLLEGVGGAVGGNVALAVGDDGVIVVDDMFAQMYGRIKAAIAAVTAQPVRYVVNTHFHRDHTGGNEAFAKDGALIVAHDNVRHVLANGSRNGLNCAVTPPVAELALPTGTYQDKLTLRLGGRTAELRHPVDVHTDGDTTLWLADANVLIAGDVVFFGRYPNIDFVYGGSIDGMIRGTDELLDFAKEDTTIVPGHGPAGSKAMLRDYRTMLAQARERIAKLKAAGKTEEEVVAAKPTADYDAKFGVNERAIGNFLRVVYRSLPK
jgi:glyoxylase-like metal-dependent hydrolase (beta-lactamase superfamily II)